MYIDPNTGGVLFQALAVLFGVFSGMVFFFSGQIKMSFAKMKRLMRERSGNIEHQTIVSAADAAQNSDPS